MELVWIYRDCLQNQTHCQNTECFFLCYSQVKCLDFVCQPKASTLLHNCNAVTLKCKKGIKTWHDKIFVAQSSSPFLLSLSSLNTFLTSYDRAGSESVSSPFTTPEKKKRSTDCVYLSPHRPVNQYEKQESSCSSSQLCCLKAPLGSHHSESYSDISDRRVCT